MTDTSEEEASCFCLSGTTEAQPGGFVLYFPFKNKRFKTAGPVFLDAELSL